MHDDDDDVSNLYADADARSMTPSRITRSCTLRSVPSSPGRSFLFLSQHSECILCILSHLESLFPHLEKRFEFSSLLWMHLLLFWKYAIWEVGESKNHLEIKKQITEKSNALGNMQSGREWKSAATWFTAQILSLCKLTIQKVNFNFNLNLNFYSLTQANFPESKLWL